MKITLGFPWFSNDSLRGQGQSGGLWVRGLTYLNVEVKLTSCW